MPSAGVSAPAPSAWPSASSAAPPSAEEAPAKKNADSKKGEDDVPPPIDPSLFRRSFTDVQCRILEALLPGIRQIDEVIENTGLSPSATLGEMTMLMIRGAVRSYPGKRFGLNMNYWKEEQANG